MSTMSPVKIYDQLTRLEQELLRIKWEAYSRLPRRQRISQYPEKAIMRALKDTREEIWRERYAKEIEGIS